MVGPLETDPRILALLMEMRPIMLLPCVWPKAMLNSRAFLGDTGSSCTISEIAAPVSDSSD